MLFDLTFPCYLTTFSGKRCLSGKVIFAFFCPAFRSSLVLQNKGGSVVCLCIGGVGWGRRGGEGRV
jgi:hypothetical protein